MEFSVWQPILLCFLVPALFGSFLIRKLHVFEEVMCLLAAGYVAGCATFITFAYFLTIWLGLEAASVVAALVLLAFTILLMKGEGGGDLKQDPFLLVLVLTLLFVIAPIASQTLIEQEGVLFTRHLNCFGDLPFHVSLIQNFVSGQTVPPENPILSGNPLLYPFLSDFYSSLLIANGATLMSAITFPTLGLTLAALVLLYALTFQCSLSKRAALFAVVLFIFGGSTLGFLRFWNESGSFGLEEFGTLPDYYSGSAGDREGFFVPNPLLAYFIPQRSFLFGLPISLLILSIFISKERSWKKAGVSGFLFGLLPLFHVHSVLALTVPLFFLAFYQGFKTTVVFGMFAAIAGIPEVAYFLLRLSPESQISYQLGWLAKEQSFLFFWLKNGGVIFLLSVLALVSVKKSSATKILALSGLVWFALGNVFLFAKWEWDNTKVFVYALILVLPLVAIFLSSLSRNRFFLPLIVAFILARSTGPTRRYSGES